jgi:hypothetical protein
VNFNCSAYAIQCHERKRQGISIIPMLPKKWEWMIEKHL